ncbi:hypothetical protein CI238_04186 [Colletotrichum incanum]|uniref:Uncharacterized protein n=1 Tax=Colletotrichum incanum TaxID=1573173 RepID=A0A161XZR1_COLIC|nr:hypothetical protein CI238_04186 [Colletotrichum incanum]OHW98033.1 suppressor protein srp40 [Colletotrichum incanum]
MTASTEPTTSDPAGPSDTSSAYTRLHITPFDQDLLKIVVPSSALPNARNISFHTLETFPEKRYGFVDLPEADAGKLKKKLNGAVLKGVKMRIDKARPVQDYTPVAEDEETGKKRKKKSKDKEERKRQKRDDNVVEGVQLRDRKVKRGWTVPEEAKIREKKSKKDKEKKEKKDKTKKREERSKYTEKEECLFKTKLPAKHLPATTEPEDEPERKKRKKKSREVIIHEFEKTTKFPTFLKATKPAPAESLTTEYIEGKGWVDAEGNVIEPPKTRRTAAAPVPESKAPKASKRAKAPTPPPQDEDSTSSSGTSSDDDTSSDESSDDESAPVEVAPVQTAPVTPAKTTPRPPRMEDDTTSSSGSSSDDSSSDNNSDDEEMADAAKVSEPAAVETPLSAIKAADASRPRSAGSNVSLTIKIPPSTPSQVHPLEALYKRPKQSDGENPQTAKEAEPFSFFSGGGDNDDLEEEEDVAPASQLPMTPFTAQEFEWRNIRSAAPTPDTAHPNHTKPFWAIGAEGDDEEEDEETREEIEATLNAERNAEAESGSAGPAGDFQKWFWDNRKSLNQSWMKRRKTAAKERRHRDNKSRASKAV